MRILLVDDDIGYRTVIARCLGRRGHDVTTCCNGHEALCLLGLQWKGASLVLPCRTAFQCIIVDYEMPLVNGLEVLGYVRGASDPSLRNVPVIAFSASSDELLEEQFVGVGATQFVRKPVIPWSFALLVEKSIT
jgi:CheY-like chemotaxis protein